MQLSAMEDPRIQSNRDQTHFEMLSEGQDFVPRPKKTRGSKSHLSHTIFELFAHALLINK